MPLSLREVGAQETGEKAGRDQREMEEEGQRLTETREKRNQRHRGKQNHGEIIGGQRD